MLDRTISPPINPLKGFEITPPIRKLLPNGSSMCIIDAGTQEVIRLDVLVKGGRYNQNKPLQAVFTNRMLREGSAKYTSSQVSEKLDYYGAWLELSTSPEHTQITLYSLTKYFPQTLDIIESIVKEPLFPEKEFRTTLTVNKQQYLVNSLKTDFISQKYLNLAVYGANHPGGKFLKTDDYEQLTREDLHTFHRNFYNSRNCSVYLSGKVTKEIIAQTESAFGSTPWGEFHDNTISPAAPLRQPAEKRLFAERNDAMQSSLKMGYATIPGNHPDFPKLRVLTTLFGGYFGSRLMANIREDKGYTYGISAGIIPLPENGLLVISTEIDNRYVEATIQEVYKEIDKLKTTAPIPAGELSMVKNYMMGNFYRTYEGPFAMADAWILTETGHLEDSYLSDSMNAIIDITENEIKYLAEKYLCPEKIIEVIAGKKTITNYKACPCLNE